MAKFEQFENLKLSIANSNMTVRTFKLCKLSNVQTFKLFKLSKFEGGAMLEFEDPFKL